MGVIYYELLRGRIKVAKGQDNGHRSMSKFLT